MKLTELFGKQIFSLYEGELVATISGATFNLALNKIKSFKVFDSEENEFDLSLSDIKAMSDFIIVANKNKLQPYLDFVNKSPMFKMVLNEDAKNLGKIIDAKIDSSGNVLSYITDLNHNLAPENIYIRKDFIYYSLSKIRISNYKPKENTQTSLANIKVSILSNNSENFTPKRVQFNPENILGKIAKTDLAGLNNEIIVKANQTITEKTIFDATRHNRLNQLYYISI